MTAPAVGSSAWLAIIRAAGRRCQCTGCTHKGRCPRVHMMASPLHAVASGDGWQALCEPCETAGETPAPKATRPPATTGRRNTHERANPGPGARRRAR